MRLNLLIHLVIELTEEAFLKLQVFDERGDAGTMRKLRVQIRRVPGAEVRPAVQVQDENDQEGQQCAE